MVRPVVAAGLLSLGMLASYSLPAAAAGIVCREDYQVVRGQEIATPYCADNYLARVAREYGVRVSNAEIRNNPNRKREVCRFVGHDIRVSHSCSDEVYRGRRGF